MRPASRQWLRPSVRPLRGEQTSVDTSTSPPVLVTGTTGRHGSTGAHVAARLRSEGRQVRVLARRHSERTKQLQAMGAEVVTGDLHRRETITHALDGVRLAYFTYPIDAGVVSAAANYAAAVQESGAEVRTVVLSMGPAHPAHLSDRGKDQWLAEEILRWAGLDVLVLRVAAAFHENLHVLHGPSVRERRVIRNCFGDARVSWINGKDAGELAVSALLHPERFDGPVCYPPGADEASHADIAAMITDATGRPVRFEDIDRTGWRQDLLDLAATDPTGVINADMADHISAVGWSIRDRGPTRPADREEVRRLIGHEPVSLGEFIARSRDAFLDGGTAAETDGAGGTQDVQDSTATMQASRTGSQNTSAGVGAAGR
ncbi:NmrA family NAD(P)-binding protein [Streptomyces nodosus]|uniref:NmrA family NAD(P)-binding protein n=1 Tax=Streptomyces nodosus TaxID=40318 RepID=UPI0034532DD0